MSYYYQQYDPPSFTPHYYVGNANSETVTNSNYNNSTSTSDINYTIAFRFSISRANLYQNSGFYEPVSSATIEIYLTSDTGCLRDGPNNPEWTKFYDLTNLNKVGTVNVPILNFDDASSNPSTTPNLDDSSDPTIYNVSTDTGYGIYYTYIKGSELITVDSSTWNSGNFNSTPNITGVKETSTISWVSGTTEANLGKLRPNQSYLLKVRGVDFNSSSPSDVILYANGNGFGLFKTLPATPPIVHPTITNGTWTSPIISTAVASTEYSAILNCTFYYQTMPLSPEMPSTIGFKYRKLGDNIWIDTNTIAFGSTIQNTNRINKSLSISGLTPNNTYEYTSYIIDNNNTYYYSNLNIITSSLSNAQKTQFTTKPQSISSWYTPQIGIEWYQLYNDWELVETSDSTNRVSPFLRVREFSNTSNTLNTLNHSDINKEYSLFYFFNKKFIKDKNYQFRTIVENFYTYKNIANISSSKNSNFKIKTPWGETFNLSSITPYFPISTTPPELKVVNLYLYTNINSFDPIISGITKQKPIESIESKNNPQNPIAYSANSYFNGNTSTSNNTNTSNSLLDVNLADIDWTIQGYAPFNITNYSGSGTLQISNDEVIPVFVSGEAIGGKGWHFIENKGSFIWFDKYNINDKVENINNLPIGGDLTDYYSNKTSNEKYLVNNFISKYISYQTFNISFDYINNTEFKISMYVGVSLPSFENNKYNLDQLINDGYIKKINTFSKSNNNLGTTQSCEFVGVDGNQYLFFVADPVYLHLNNSNEITQNSTTYLSTIDNSSILVSTTYSVINLSNFKISGSYNDLNNQNFDINANIGYSTINLIDNATYSIKLGTGNNVIPGSVTSSVITINSLGGNGRFNSGIWENGVWNNGWREDLTRRDFYKIDQFYSYNKDKKWNIRISGPISSISKFTIGDKVSISNIVAIDINEERKLLKKYYTIVDLGTNYIEVEFENDFPLRRIEMDSDQHRIYVSKNVWLSGVFLNGYFKGIWNSGLFSGYPLITKMDESHWIDGAFNGGHFIANKYGTTFSSVFTSDGITRLGLSFTTPHNLTKDDIISISPNVYYDVNQSTQTGSLGTTIVSEVIDEYKLVTGISWKTEYSYIINGGIINSIISTGLIQNFDFYSNNVSKVTSIQSMQSESVFSYNSWIDVNYSNQSAVNIGKPQSILDADTKRSYSENNLYGYPTNDVLSSNSAFRDSFSTTLRKYKLGKKWKIFNDYVGDSSSFEEYFDSSDTSTGIEAFNNQGWDISFNSNKDVLLIADSLDYTEPFDPINTVPTGVTYSVNDVTVYFNNDISHLLTDSTVTLKGVINKYINWSWSTSNVDYISSATVSSTSYSTQSNKTSVSLKTNIPVYTYLNKDIGGNVYTTSIDSLKRDAKTYIDLSLVNSITFSRTPEPLDNNSSTIGKELKVNAKNRGGYLNLIPAYDILNRTNGSDTQTLDKSRYTMIEFDLVDHLSSTSSYIEPSTNYLQPSIHFNNLNYVTRNVNSGSATQSIILPASYLPINKNINHLLTRSKKKQEFFFNKRNLLMNFRGTGAAGSDEAEYYLDNIKLYQINMVPFFQYFTNPIGIKGNINKSVQIPNNGVSPIIDFTEDNIIDSNNDNNEIITFFSNSLISSNIEIPEGINSERDYSIYRTQIPGNDILGNDDLYLEN